MTPATAKQAGAIFYAMPSELRPEMVDPLIWHGIAVFARDTPPMWPVMATC